MQSRYYDPAIGRFINADGLLLTNELTGMNLFAYCFNNPVNLIDQEGKNPTLLGTWAESMWWLCLVDAAAPVGDMVYVLGALLLGTGALLLTQDSGPSTDVFDGIVSYTPIPPNNNKKNDDKEDKTTPNKDSRLKGEPGTVNKEGYKETYIGEDGKAFREIHKTDHGNPAKHSNPHYHDITWDMNGNPVFGPPQNQWGGEIPLFP